MAMSVKHAESKSSSGFSGHQPFTKLGTPFGPKLECKYLGKFFNTKWPNRCNCTLEKLTAFLFRDVLQDPFVCVTQSNIQFVQNFPDS